MESGEYIDAEFKSPFAGSQIIRTSPMTVGSQLSSRISFLCTAPTAESLQTVETFCADS